ncbi:glycosyl hydrolase family 65 protein [Gordonia jinhuaensis]|uniref:Glycosyl hydrolase n=1 Tax=Gordonia jinhuaensis TaxID=1517702 RepID=A0A916T724_9ACTN|nr:glycoside hydrolase family 65 protein [Gordonia jinhuaensis]GGB34078.1 glycosyl hydrolase [Gordonia jinhuaensis]
MFGFEVDPWQLRWNELDAEQIPRTESLFALSNGHIGMRGSLEEGEPIGEPGTYLNGLYELRALPYAESGYGYPESGQTIINVTDGKIIRLLVEDEPMDLRYGRTLEHTRTLDLRSGTLRRTTVWESPVGHKVRISTERLVSFTNRAIAAIKYEVEALDDNLKIVIQSDLLANEPIGKFAKDPRLAEMPEAPLVNDFATSRNRWAVLVHHTKMSGLRVAAGMDHEWELPSTGESFVRSEGDLARLTLAAHVPQGRKLSLTKYIGYGWSARRSVPAVRAQVDAALAMAMEVGWDTLLSEQRSYLDDFWRDADVELEGDAELQQAVRFAMFHVLQAGARGEARSIGAKGLTGSGYDGHTFWDTETFVLPVLTYTSPAAAREVLRWRHSTLDKARNRASELGQFGAMFPWRSINGDECSSYWPAGTAAVHITADIAHATAKYLNATHDKEFEAECGLELLVECARLWLSVGHFDGNGRFRIDGITGPDEYTAVVNNNVYTNLMAEQNLRDAAAVCSRNPDLAREFGVTVEEIADWEIRAERIFLPYNETLGVHEQSEEFTQLKEWDFEASKDKYPLLLNYPYFDLYRKQVVKQADLVLALYLRGDAFTPEEKRRNFDYYERITVRDSSLSAWSQGVMAAEVGYLDLAYDYLVETAFTDLHDIHNNVAAGLHIAAMAGTWLGCVAGFGGMRDYDGNITFAPRLPPRITYLSFRMLVGGSKILVAIDGDNTIYRLLFGPPVTLKHHGEEFELDGHPVTLPIPPLTPHEPPAQPIGREPYRRSELR